MTTGLKIAIGATIGAGAIGGTAGIVYVLTQPNNLKEDLEKSGVKFLNTKTGQNGDDVYWQKLAEKHAEDTVPNGIKKIANLTIQKQSGSPAPATPHPGIQQLKTKCEELFKKTKKDTDYDQSKVDAKNWCTKEQISTS